jgi:hypothetical protein
MNFDTHPDRYSYTKVSEATKAVLAQVFRLTV